MLMHRLRQLYLRHRCLLIPQCNDKHQQRINRHLLLHPHQIAMHLHQVPHPVNQVSLALHQELRDQLHLIRMPPHHRKLGRLRLLLRHKLSHKLQLLRHQELDLLKLHYHRRDHLEDLPWQGHRHHGQAQRKVKVRPLRRLDSFVSIFATALRNHANVYTAAGDRSHIGPGAQPVYDTLNAEMQRVKAVAPANYKGHVDDAEKRLNILFDQLNNSAIGGEALSQLQALAEAFGSRNFEQAQAIHGALAQFPEVSSPALVSIVN